MASDRSIVLDHYDRQVVSLIVEKYGLPPMEAVREFVTSRSHELLEDPENGLWSFPPYALFDMWEAEKVTGTPSSSSFVRGE